MGGRGSRDASAARGTWRSERPPATLAFPRPRVGLFPSDFGLGLTGADDVIVLDPWWSGRGDQAADRAYRIGQDKPVMVDRIVTVDSIDERVLRLQDEKRRLATSPSKAWRGRSKRATSKSCSRSRRGSGREGVGP